MSTPVIPRCNAAERARYRKPISAGYADLPGFEPALGTLDQRLAILVRRHGGRVKGLPAMSAAEKREYALLFSSVMATREDVPST